MSFIIDIATRKSVSRPIIERKSKFACYIAFFLPEGKIIHVNGIQDVKMLPYVHHNNLDSLTVRKSIGRSIDKTSRFFLILEAPTKNELEERIAQVKMLLKVDVACGNEVKGVIWD